MMTIIQKIGIALYLILVINLVVIISRQSVRLYNRTNTAVLPDAFGFSFDEENSGNRFLLLMQLFPYFAFVVVSIGVMINKINDSSKTKR